MRITTLKLVVLAILFANTAYAFELVTPDEVSQSQDALMLEAELSVPDPLGPMIQLLDPVSLDMPFKNPFKMEVIFKPQNGSEVDFSTFKDKTKKSKTNTGPSHQAGHPVLCSPAPHLMVG
jgi:hypothetical protein